MELVIVPCEHVQIIVSVTEQMEKDYWDCAAKAELIGDGKRCDGCSWNKVDVFGTCVCELPVLADHLKKWSTGRDSNP